MIRYWYQVHADFYEQILAINSALVVIDEEPISFENM